MKRLIRSIALAGALAAPLALAQNQGQTDQGSQTHPDAVDTKSTSDFTKNDSTVNRGTGTESSSKDTTSTSNFERHDSTLGQGGGSDAGMGKRSKADAGM